MNGAFRYAGDLFPELARLQQHLDEVFQTGVANSIRGFARGTFPAINVGTSVDTVEIVAFAPGVDPKGLQITVDRGLLTIAGERPGISREDKDTLHAQERFVHRVECLIQRLGHIADFVAGARVHARRQIALGDSSQ